MTPSAPLPRLLLLLALLLLPATLLGSTVLAPPSAVAGDEDDGGGGDDDDPFADGGDDDFFKTPTTFSPDQAEKAIKAGVTYLKKIQNDDGSWGEGIIGNAAYGGGQMQGQGFTHPAGATALVLYAMLKCKVSLRDPSVRKGFDWLKKRHEKPQGSYETSMMLLAVTATANPFKTSSASAKRQERLRLKGTYRRWAQDLHEHLLEKKTGPGWRYQVTGQPAAPDGSQDLSSTQLAALALFAADQAGLRTPESVWEDVLQFSMAQQDTDGPAVVTKDPLTGQEVRRRARGFAYIKGAAQPDEGQATGAMTACGIANLMMARYVLSDAGRAKEAWDARPDAARVQEAVEDGVTWLAENWSPYANPRKQSMNIYHLYWMYAVERAMDLIGHQRIGQHMWYSEMGQQLINRQNEEGWWDSESTHEPRKILDTCFALLVLKKATSGQIPFPSITGGSDEPPVDNR